MCNLIPNQYVIGFGVWLSFKDGKTGKNNVKGIALSLVKHVLSHLLSFAFAKYWQKMKSVFIEAMAGLCRNILLPFLICVTFVNNIPNCICKARYSMLQQNIADTRW
jgi:hypothetical protein